MIWGNRLNASEFKYIGSFPHFVADGGDDRVGRWLNESIDLAASMPKSGKMRRLRTWSMCPCSATATTRTPPASATSPNSNLKHGEVRTGCPCTRVERHQLSDCRGVDRS